MFQTPGYNIYHIIKRLKHQGFKQSQNVTQKQTHVGAGLPGNNRSLILGYRTDSNRRTPAINYVFVPAGF